jgi:hypothetical protein
MKKNKILIYTIVALAALAMVTGLALAEDGVLFRRNVSKTPEGETEKAAIYMMDFYVPAQSSSGLVGPVDNYILDDGAETPTLAYDARDYAKPLVTVYIDEIGVPVLPDDEMGIASGLTLGEFDAFAGVSLDDGTSWKRTNLSRSADLSSFNLANGEAFPGGVHNVVHQVADDHILVAWVSKYCDGGNPLYKLSSNDANLLLNAVYLADLEDTYGKDVMYLYDLFGVNGQQGSVDYTLQGHPEVGEIPYSCVWTARGKLLAGDDPSTTDNTEATYVMWTKPERLTSGARDANLPAVDCAMGAGCILTWQEDPEGLRPGQGLGPGEGWSGAIANGKTDIWYSYISYADFDKVFAVEDTVGAITMADYATGELTALDTIPKPYVPMAMPVRLTDNNMCKDSKSDPYCYIDFSDLENLDPTALPTAPSTEGNSTYCESTIPWTTPGGSTLQVCVTEDGRVLNGRVASTRVRLNLKPYSTGVVNDNGTPDDPTDDFEEKSAWVIMAAEETKAMGDLLIDPYGNPVEDPLDVGKDIWYYSFDMFEHPTVDQGGMLNQPAVCSPWTVYKDVDAATCTPYEFFPVQEATITSTDPTNPDNENVHVIGDFYLTEIARRFALTTNSVSAAVNSESGLSAMLIYKQGIINQGGPADIMLRRVIIPDTFDPAADNPYAFENMECDEWAYTDGLNPNYLKGICLSPAINISGTTIVECTAGELGNDDCADTFPVADDGSIPDNEASFPKVFEWRQCDGDTSDGAIEGCEDDNDLDDQTWENPFDMAKGHRGFLDGDFVMMMYAWSPNWKAQTVGNDHYNLYVRRSFDGGATWTTTPAELDGDGTTATENYCVLDPSACEGTEFVYNAGAFEQGRNVSQLIGNKITILDPRYSPTGGLKLYPYIRTDWLSDNLGITFAGYEDDIVRDPSKFFMIYETGDNTTVAEGEAVPLNLYYSRATVYGDVWELDEEWLEDQDEWIWRWPWAENKAEILSGEASMLANPGGTFMYAVWNQWQEEILPDGHELIFDSDMIFRRFMYLPDDTTITVELPPTAYIAYQSTESVLLGVHELVTIVGGARDWSGAGITGYQWRTDEDGVVGSDRKFELPTNALVAGKHTIFFSVVDGNGKWSREVPAVIDVIDPIEPTPPPPAEPAKMLFIPIIRR